MTRPRIDTRNRIKPPRVSRVFTRTEDGLVPAPETVTGTRALFDDGTWNTASGGGGSTPTGTGFVHVTSGSQDAAAKLVENADVHAAAAIVESKLALNFATHTAANDPSATQKAALVGTNGTPSGANPYVTDSDPRLAGSSLADGDYGDVTVSSSGTVITIDNDVVTFAKMQNITTDRLLGRDTVGTADVELISVGGGIEFTDSTSIQTSAFTGDVTKTAGGTALTIANDAVTYAKMQNIGTTDRLLGLDAAAPADPTEIAVTGGIEFTGSNSIQTTAFTGDVTKTAGGTALTLADTTDLSGTMAAQVMSRIMFFGG